MKNFIKKIFSPRLVNKLKLLLNYNNYYTSKKKIIYNYNLKKKKIIFLIPENKIFLYFIYHAFLGIIFKKLGYEIYFLKCYNNLAHCKVMPHDYFNPLERNLFKKILCNSCNNITNKYLNIFDFKIIHLKNLNTKKIFLKINSLDSLNKIKNYKFEGLYIGQLSFYDFHINQKISYLHNLSEDDIEILKKYILSITNFILNLKLIIKDDFSHYIILDEYCSDLASRIFLKNKKLSVFRSSILYHKNEDPSYLSVTRTSSVIEENFIKLNYWSKYKNLSLTKNLINDICEDLNTKIFDFGTHNFSKNKNTLYINLHKKLNINKNKKITVLYSSSEDEHCALLINYKFLKLNNGKKIFKNNFEWIDETISIFSKLSNSHLIIKFHPRIGKTFRDGFRSDVYEIYKKKYFNSQYKNVTILDPETSISSYDLADICDLALVGWGTIGLELARLGVPVIVAMQSFMSTSPNLNLLKVPKNKIDYLKLIIKNLDKNENLHISDIIDVFRWYHLHKLSNAFYEKNLKNWRDYNKIDYRKFSKKNLHGFNLLLNDKTRKKEIIDIKYKFLLNDKNYSNAKKEKKAVLEFMKNISKKFILINSNSKIALRLNQIVKY
jgi:hypothetical protein